MMNLTEDIALRKQQGLFRERQVIESAQGARVKINGEEFVNFCSNDYLGFANDLDLKDQMIKAINDYGSGSSQLLTGHSILHKQLEQKLASFLKRDAALVLPSGYQANLAIASTLIDSTTVVLQDKLNHASLVDAALLSKAKLVRYAHNNIEQLATLLEKYKQQSLIVMTDGVFSMDGDYALINEMAELCTKYKALLVIDDAHGIGVLGNTGAGLLEELDLDQKQVPLLVGTFGKSFGACGAFVSGPEQLIQHFIQKARTYIYTTALLPSIAATMSFAIDKIVNGSELRAQIRKLISLYIRLMTKNQIQTISQSHIQPFIVGEIKETIRLSDKLYEKKILASAIRPPTVPKGTARLRVSITAKHTKENIEDLVSVLCDPGVS